MKKGIVALIFLLVIMPNVFALSTNIHVRAVPDTQTTLLIFNEAGSKILLNRGEYSGSSGEYAYEFNNDAEKFKITIKVKDIDENLQLLYEDFGLFEAGEDLWLQAIPGNISKDYMKLARENEAKKAEEEAAKKAEEEAAALAAQEAAKKAEEEAAALAAQEAENAKLTTKLKGITGKVSFSLGGVSKTAYYIVGGIVLAFIIGVLLHRHGEGMKMHLPHFGGSKLESLQARLRKEEDRVKETKLEIYKLKNDKAERIKEMERKLKENEAELKKLMGKDGGASKKHLKNKKDDIKQQKDEIDAVKDSPEEDSN